jgi:hypothetical protein
MSIKKHLRKIANLGIVDFETVAEVRERQADLLDGVKADGLDHAYSDGLADCQPKVCGRKHCTDACAFGARHRRAEEIVAVHRLFKAAHGPIFEVRLERQLWERRRGELRTVSLAAVKKFNSRALDTLYNRNVMAIGIVTVAVQFQAPCWTAQIHQIVVGASKTDLDRAFSNLASIKQVADQDLPHVISSVLRRDLQLRHHPFEREPWGPTPKRKHRAEFYQWVLRLDAGARMIRYGCDRHFKKLMKKERKPPPPKIPKKRPYPIWLKNHMFGSKKWEDTNPLLLVGTKPLNKISRIVDPGPDYYTDTGEPVSQHRRRKRK